MPRRKRLPPKPEPPPDGMMYLGLDLVPIIALEEMCKDTLIFNDGVPDYRNDPSYNWRRPRGKRKAP